MSKLFLKNNSRDGSVITLSHNGKKISLGDKEEREFDLPSGAVVSITTSEKPVADKAAGGSKPKKK